MKVLMGGAAALALAVMAGQTVAGGMDVPDADISAISESDTGSDTGAEDGPKDGTDGPRSDGTDAGETDAGDTDAGDADTGETHADETGETGTNTHDTASEEEPSFNVTGFLDGEWSDDFKGEIVHDDDTADGTGTEDTADTGTDDTANSGTEGATDDTADGGTEDRETGDTPLYDQHVMDDTVGGVTDEIDTNLVTDIGVFLPQDGTEGDTGDGSEGGAGDSTDGDSTEGDTGDSTDDSTDTTTDSDTEWPIDYTSYGPIEDSLPDVMITITSEPQSQPDMLDGIAEIVLQPTASAPPGAPGLAPDLGVADIGAASPPNDDGTDCVFRPDRRAVICD
ncbi:MAG: hypothetical protein H9533_19805 [Rhodobacteraceae bacterium]|nr:hypothetical protein [Paracoccaceae bacterium]